jgi:methionyl-tRNA synthetase
MLASWKVRAEVRSAFDDYDFADGLGKIWSLIATVNDFLLENDPVALAEDPSQKHRISNVLYDACQGLAFIVQLLHPILPDTTDRIWKALGQTTVLEEQLIGSSIWGLLAPGTVVEKLQPLFPHADEIESNVLPIQSIPEPAFVLKRAV